MAVARQTIPLCLRFVLAAKPRMVLLCYLAVVANPADGRCGFFSSDGLKDAKQVTEKSLYLIFHLAGNICHTI
jgi:hypothetical protein